jgi:hypothetical protein
MLYFVLGWHQDHILNGLETIQPFQENACERNSTELQDQHSAGTSITEAD